MNFSFKMVVSLLSVGTLFACASSADPGEELPQRDQQVGISGNADAQETGHEMGVDHRVLQLRPLALDGGRYRLPRDFGQCDGEGVTGIEAEKMIETEIRNAAACPQQIGRLVQRPANDDGGNSSAERFDGGS